MLGGLVIMLVVGIIGILFGLLMLVVCYSIKSDFNKQKIVKDGLERKNSRLQHEIELLRQNEADISGCRRIRRFGCRFRKH